MINFNCGNQISNPRVNSMSVVSTLSNRPMSARRMTLTDQAALDREWRSVKETTNQNQNIIPNKTNNKVPRPTTTLKKNKD